MKKWVSLFLCLLLFGGMVCAQAQDIVNVYNWEDYIDQFVLERFEEETGIKVNYLNFTSNEDMLVQVRANPEAFDVVFPADYAVERLIAEDRLEPLNFDNIPSAKANTVDWLQNPSYDKEGKYSVPYMWATLGLLYNKDKVTAEPNSWSVLWDMQYKDNIFMYDSIRPVMGIGLKAAGYSMNSTNPLELEAAKAKLIEQKQLGVVRAYQLDETKDKMIANEVAIAVIWSGDAQYAISHNDRLAYAVPSEGSAIGVDSMVIPKGARNKENAEKFIEFMCRPDIARINSEAIGYPSANAKAIALMGSGYSDNPVMNPSKETIQNLEFFVDIQNFIDLYNAIWLEVKNAK